MAIDQIYFEFLSKAINMIGEDKLGDKRPFKIGCLSYPDLLVSREQIVNKFPNLQK